MDMKRCHLLIPNDTKTKRPLKIGERSFTLIETIIAIGLLVTFILEISTAQGRALYFSEYQMNVTKATWLAKSVMTKVEYEFLARDLKDMTWSAPGAQTFKDLSKDFEGFTYKISIEEWKLPIIDLLLNGKGGGDEDSKEDAGGAGDLIKQQIESVLGDSVLKLAHVEVFWLEGAVKNSTTLTLLLPNIRGVDKQILAMKPIATEGGNKPICGLGIACKEGEICPDGTPATPGKVCPVSATPGTGAQDPVNPNPEGG
jgi:hypothetical protein